MRTTQMACALALVVALASAPAVAQKEEPLQAHVTPRYAVAPAIVRIRAIVQPSADNRELEFVIDSPLYYRSSTVHLSGAAAARVHRVEFPSVPAGWHEVRVVLRNAAGDTRAIMYQHVVLVE